MALSVRDRKEKMSRLAWRARGSFLAIGFSKLMTDRVG